MSPPASQLVACALALAAVLGGCRSGGAEPGSHDAGPDAGVRGHPTPGPGQSAAWQVVDPADLVGGPSTAGRVGDWVMANSRVRFVIEGPHASDGYDPYGCAPIAADLQRPAGTPGESRFGEMVLMLNFRGISCQALELASDGSDDGTAVLRAAGHDAVLPYAASLFSAGTEPPALHATIFRDYALAPDAAALQLTLTVRNDGEDDLHLDAVYAALAMNRGLRHWVPGSGFDFSDLAQVNPRAQFYAAVGDRVSYSLLNRDSPFSPIVDFAKILFGQYGAATLPPGQSHAWRFLIGVGAGDVGSLQSAQSDALGASSALLSGRVVGPRGEPVASARVHLTDQAGALVSSFARTAADGSFSAALPAGSYAARAVADDRGTGPLVALTLGAAGQGNLRLTLGAPSRIEVTAADATGPLPVKVVAEPVANGRPKLPAALGEKWDFAPVVAFPETGRASLAVFPGQWRVTVSRGFEYDLARTDVTAPAGGAAQVAALLHRVVDTTSWMSGDFHVHAQNSIDGDDLLSEKVRAFAGEGVEIPVSTEHEFIGDFGPQAAALGLQSVLHSMAGTELTTTFIGHFNIFPLLPDPSAVNHGAFSWYGRPVPEVIAEARTRTTAAGAPIVQLNHPRSSGMAYLDAVQFDPFSFTVQANAQHFMTGWDAMEVWNGTPLVHFEGCLADPSCEPPIGLSPTAADWFGFLDRGLKITGTGNSDSHTASLREVGFPRTYLRLGVDDPGAVTDKLVTAALRAQAAVISGGPFVLPSAPDRTSTPIGPGGVALADQTSGSPVVHLHLEVQAPTWMGPLSRVDIWRGDANARMGAVRALTLDLTQGRYLDRGTSVRRLSTTVDVPTPQDTWLVVTVRGANPHALWPVVQAEVPPFAITNPIWVDADGDGQVKPLR